MFIILSQRNIGVNIGVLGFFDDGHGEIHASVVIPLCIGDGGVPPVVFFKHPFFDLVNHSNITSCAGLAVKPFMPENGQSTLCSKSYGKQACTSL